MGLIGTFLLLYEGSLNSEVNIFFAVFIVITTIGYDIDETILNPGEFTQVKPGKIHQFEGLKDGVAFELYWAEFNHNDIIRRTVGTKT